MEERIAAVERRQSALESRLQKVVDELDAQTKTINDIKSDTGQIVMLFKASQFGAMIVKWLAYVGSAIIVGYAAIKGLSGH